MSIDPDSLAGRLRREFGGGEGEARAVARQAADLADAGLYDRDVGAPLSGDAVLEELADAPEGTPADRWNWWLGALELAHGGYREFGVSRFPA